jgi:hypothetical protein
MNYIHTPTLAQLSESEIRALNPNTSFGNPFVAPADYALVFPAPQPAYNPITQRVQAIAPELTVLGHWEQRWEVVEWFETQEEKDAAIAADLEAKRVAVIPSEISPRQIRQALTAAGLRSSVEAAVSTADQDTKDWWEFATTFERSHPRVIGMAEALGVTPVQMDDLWTLAGSLK